MFLVVTHTYILYFSEDGTVGIMALGVEKYHEALQSGIPDKFVPQVIQTIQLFGNTISPEMKPFATKMIDGFYFPDKYDPLLSLRNALDYSR